MTERSKLTVKTGTPSRDPRRRPVRGGRAPLPPAPTATEAHAAPVERKPPSRPARAQPGPPGSRGGAPAHRPMDRAPDRIADRPAEGPAVRPTTRPAEDGLRLSKWLSDQGQASRREADDWIAAGWVRVNGTPAVLGQRVTAVDRIEIDPAARRQQLHSVTVLINKPLGFVSGQAEDGHEPAAVLVTAANRWAEDRGMPWNPAFARGLAPAGRLDIDSTGLLVLTQDGRVARHLIGEDSDVEKEYLVRVQPLREGAFHPDDIEWLRHGLELDGKRLLPAKVSWANEDQLRIVLREGRKRQIRRMCELVGLRVVALKRVRIGSVVLGKLPPGQWRLLRRDERF